MKRRAHRWKRGFSCRCWNRRCRLYGHRFHRALRPAEYAPPSRRWALCPGCKRELIVDSYRSSGREAKASRCKCGGYHFPHRRGALFCVQGRAGSRGFNFMGAGSARAFEEAAA